MSLKSMVQSGYQKLASADLQEHWLVRYSLAAILALAAMGLRLAIIPIVGDNIPYLTLFPTMMVVSVMLGWGPGMLTTIIGMLIADYYLVPPVGTINLGASFLSRSAILLATSAYVGWVSQRLRNERMRAESKAEEARVAEAALRRQVELIDPARATIIMEEMQRTVQRRPVEKPGLRAPSVLLMHRGPDIAGALAIIVGVLVTADWLFGVSPLKNFFPGMSSMKFNTAVCLAVAGAALLFRERRVVRIACASFILGIGVLSFSEYVTNTSFGLDQVFVFDPGDLWTVPGRMAQTTAFCLMFYGAALLSLKARRSAIVRVEQTLLLGAIVIPYLVILGYLYETSQLLTLGGSSTMALHTALTFMVLSLGALFARADGMMSVFATSGPGARLATLMLPSVVLLPAILGWLHTQGEVNGLFSSAFGAGLFVLVMSILMITLVWWIARVLNREDASRRETEMKLRNQAELMNHAHEAFIVRETDGTINYWNLGAEALYGWSATEAIGRRTYLLLQTDVVSVKEFGRSLEDAGVWEGELVHTTRDGRLVTVESRQSASRDAEGRLLILESNRDITLRKTAEKLVSDSERKLTALLNAADESIWMSGVDGRILAANSTAARRFGSTPEELIGTHWRENVSQALAESRGTTMDQVIQSGLPTSFEDEQGGLIFHHDFYPVRDANGVVGGVVAFSRDITRTLTAERDLKRANQQLADRIAQLEAATAELQASRRAALNLMDDTVRAQKRAEEMNIELRREINERERAEAALLEREQRLRFHVENSPLAVVEWDASYIVTRWSKEAESMFGWSASETLGKPIGDLNMIFEEDIPIVNKTMERLSSGKERAVVSTNRNKTKRGDVLVCTWYNSVLLDSAGAMASVMSLVLDITERERLQKELQASHAALELRVQRRTADLRRANEDLAGEIRERILAAEALRQSEEQYRLLTETSNDYILVHDAAGHILFANRAAQESCGWDEDEPRNFNIVDIIAPEFRPAMRNRLDRPEGDKSGILRYETAFLCASGRRIVVDVSSSMITQGMAAGHVLIAARDITERKADEEREHVINSLLELFAEKNSTKEYLESVVAVVHGWAGCEAIGIRVTDDRHDIPYNTSIGFPAEFLHLEHTLSLEHDSCLCVHAVSQDWDGEEKGLLTDTGSLRCENLSGFIRCLPSRSVPRYRGHCAKFGYESVAVVPIRYRDKVLGAFHLVDKRVAYFSPESVAFLESLSPLVGEAIFRFQTEAELARHRENLEVLVNKRTVELLTANEQLQKEVAERMRVQEGLSRSEEQYRSLFSTMTEGFALHEIICDDAGKPYDYRFLQLNPAFERLTGLRREVVVGRTHNEVLPEDDTHWVEEYGSVALTGEPLHFENYSQSLQRHYEVFAYRPAPRQFAVLFIDITDRKKSEQELQRLNRTLRALSESSEAISRLDDETTYLNEACRIITRVCGHAFAWIGYAEEDREKSIRPVAHAGFEEGYLETLHLTWADTERGRGPTGTAIRTGSPAMSRNILTDPNFTPWRGEAVKRGYASSLVLPLQNAERTFGALSIYSKDPDPFSDDEVRLLSELADDLSYGILALRMREAKAKAEESRAQSEERYRNLVELSPDAIFVNQDNRIVLINSAAIALFGAADEVQLIGKSPFDIFHPDSHPMLRQRIQTVLGGGVVDLIEEKIVCLDGSFRDVDVVASRIMSQEGPAIQVVLRDITARKQTEERVRRLMDSVQEERDRLQALLSSIADEVWFADTQKNFVLTNPSARREFLAEADNKSVENVAQSVEVFYPDMRPRPVEEAPPLRALKGEILRAEEEIVRTPAHGELRYRQVSAAPVKDARGQIIGSVSVVRDITDLKRTEESLRETRNYLNNLLDYANAPIIVWDPELRITRFNRAFERLTGRRADEVIGEKLQILFPLENRVWSMDLIRSALAGDRLEAVEIPILSADGSVRTVLWNSATLYGQDGKTAVATIAQGLDITIRKQALEALSKKTEALAQSNAELEQFAYIASHDLQEPLRMVSSYVQLLAERYRGKLDADADDFVHYAVDGAMRMQKMINDLLTYSRIGTREKKYENVSLESVLRQVTESLKLSIEKNSAKITYEALPVVYGDQGRLIQLFQNLIENAIKFQADRPPRVHISAQLEGDEFLCAVRDNGIGIESEYMEKVFALFVRLHSRNEYPGTGIGLAVCKRIVEQHGGRIWIESTPGEGSTFFFTLATQSRKD